MGTDIILELAGNATCYFETVHAENKPEYIKCADEFEEILNKLCENLSEDEKREILWKLSLAQGGMESVYADEFFKAGFKLGLTLAAQNLL